MPAKKKQPRKRAPGAGRKPTGKTVRTRSVSMPHTVWDHIDAKRGRDSLGRFIARAVMGSETSSSFDAIRKIAKLSHTNDQPALWNAIEDAQQILPENVQGDGSPSQDSNKVKK